MKHLFLGFCLLVASQTMAWSMDAGMNFNPETFYDIYMIGQGQGSFVMRHIRIVDKSASGPEAYLVIKSDKIIKDVDDKGYIFMKGVLSIVPSSFFIIEPNAGN